MYQIEHPNEGMIRAWQGHEIENKWFYVLDGAFAVGWVEIDYFVNPSNDLSSIYKVIEAFENIILYISKGYANGIKSLKPNSKFLVF